LTEEYVGEVKVQFPVVGAHHFRGGRRVAGLNPASSFSCNNRKASGGTVLIWRARMTYRSALVDMASLYWIST
jgi:hypothetical protein